MIYPDLDKQLILVTDASRYGLGFFLAQEDEDGNERPIAYSGRALRAHEKRWSVTDLECLSLIERVKQFHPFLATKRFIVRTDRMSLRWFREARLSNPRLIRWSVLLQTYDFTIEYKKGTANSAADSLSRIPYPEEPETEDDILRADEPELVSEHLLILDDNNEHVSKDKNNMNDQVSEDNIYKEDSQPEVGHEPDVEQQTVTFPDDMPPLHKISHLQRVCSQTRTMIEYLERGVLPKNPTHARTIVIEAGEFCIDDDGVLYHFFHPRFRGRSDILDSYIKQLVVSSGSLRRQVLVQHHDLNGHTGCDNTYLTIRRKYYWKGLYSDVRRFIISCEKCQLSKKPTRPPKAPLHPIPVPEILNRWNIDVLKLNKSREGHVYLLCALKVSLNGRKLMCLKTRLLKQLLRN